MVTETIGDARMNEIDDIVTGCHGYRPIKRRRIGRERRRN